MTYELDSWGGLAGADALGALGVSEEALTYRQRVLATQPAALLAYWPLGEASGTAVVDAGPAGRGGTYSTVTLGASGIGDGATAAQFNGATSYANVLGAGLASAVAAAGAEGTLMQWVRLTEAAHTDAATRRSLTVQADSSNRIMLEHDASNTDRLNWYYIAGGVTKTAGLTYLSSLTGGWAQLALSWNKAQDRVIAYLNGAQVGATQTGLGVWAGTPSTMVLGAGNTSPLQPWAGDLAHTAIWAKELTGAEITGLFTPVPRSVVVFEGDSRTVGTGATNVATNYPSQAIRKLAGSWRAANVATGGETVATMIGQVSGQVAPLFSATNQRNVAAVFGGVNDNTTAATLHSRLATLCGAIRAAGFQVVVCSKIDCQSPAHAAWHATEYQALNALIRANYASYADAIADLGADSRLQDATNLTYYTADKTHLTSAGYGVIASIVAAAISGL